MEREREQLKSIIDEWNVNRLELFALSDPNEELEFHGVMRFYFQDAGQKIATKCIRVSSTACTQDVINILIEKFRPDIRMLSIPEYALYETYENGEERKLADEEKPLLVQLNWHHDDREGRFLLRRMDEKSYLPGFDPEQSNFKRKLSKREKKEKRKAEKEQMRMQNKQQQQQSSGSRENETATTKVSEKLYTEVPENSFTRSISNPEAVMRRRRKQKLEKKLQQFCQEGGVDAGGTLRIFGETLNPDVPYKTLLLSTQDTALYVVREILDKYGREKEECNNYCLIQLIVPHEQQHQMANGGTTPLSDHNGNPAIREYILDDEDCPLAIEKQHQRVRGSLSFHIRIRPADYQPRKKKKKPLHLKPEFEVNSEEILQRLHSLNPTTNNHHNHTHLPHHLHNNNNHNGSNQMQQQQQQQMGAGAADSGIASSGISSSREQQLLGEMPVPQKYMNDSERSSTNSQNISQHFTPHSDSDPSVTPHSPATALPPNHPASQPSVTDSGGHFFPNSDSQLHQLQQQHQQRDRRSGSDQGHDSGSAGIPMNGVAPAAAAGQLLAKRQNTGPETDVIIFKKGGGGMGLSIVATQGLGQQKLGIYIKNVVPGGAADQDGRLQAGDQLLAVDGNSLIGVTQEQAAELISKTGPQVTLEVARNAAAYYGLANLINQPSPQVTRHPRIMSHSQSYANQPQAQRQTPQQQSQQQHYLSQQFLPQSATLPAGMTHPGHGLQHQPSYANAPIASSAVPGSHLMQQAQLVPAMPSLLQSQSSLIQEERHYQNISMYRQPQPPLPNPPSGLTSSASVRALNNAYAHPPHHNSYSSLHALHAASNPQQQINSATLPGRPMSTVYPNNMMGRVSSMAQYPTYATGPSSQMQAQQQQIYRSGHTGSVPALHPSHNQWGRDGVAYGAHLYQPANGTIPGISQMNQSQQQQLYGRNGSAVAGASMLPPPARVSIVSTKGLIDGEQPPTGYRYVPSAYPTKSMDSLNNNNNNLMMNGHNNNNNNMNQQQQLWRRNKNNSSSSAQEFNAQIEEQEERLRLLKLEEMKRHHELEVEQIQIAEERLLKEAKTRRGQDDDGGAGKTSRAYQDPEVLPPLPKSPPPLDPVVPLMSQQPSSRPETSRVAFRNHLMQAPVSQDEGRQHPHPSSALRVNGDVNGAHVPSAAPVPAKKAVSWNDTPAQAVATQSPAEVLTNGTGVAAAGNSTSGITLEDIDEVLGSSTEQDEPSALIPNTPNVIGSQEVYRDPRERMMQEKLKNKQKVASQGPEQLSFKEKMQMFAMEQSGGSASAGKSALKSATRVIAENANSIPEEES